MPPVLMPADRRRVETLRRWAGTLDAAFRIPGTQVRFGLDAIVGLVPGAGDALMGLFSAAIILQAAKMGIPRIVIARMVVNSVLDLAVGVVPVIGDLFDVAWKANLRNVRLLERHAGGARAPSPGDYAFVGLALALLVAAAALPVVGVLLLLSYLGRSVV